MGFSQLNELAEELDEMMMMGYGLKTCAPLITNLQEPDGSFTEENQIRIAKYVYRLYKNKWDSLVKFAEEELDIGYSKVTKTVTEYGRVTDVGNEGTDVFEKQDFLAGFDSTDFADDAKTTNGTTYGKKTKTENSGQNTMTTKVRDGDINNVVQRTLDFWDKQGITRTIIGDCLKEITLPLYDV